MKIRMDGYTIERVRGEDRARQAFHQFCDGEDAVAVYLWSTVGILTDTWSRI